MVGFESPKAAHIVGRLDFKGSRDHQRVETFDRARLRKIERMEVEVGPTRDLYERTQQIVARGECLIAGRTLRRMTKPIVTITLRTRPRQRGITRDAPQADVG